MTTSTPETISIATLTGLLSFKSLYMLIYGWAFGMWVIAYKALPRQQFGNLQHRTFPIYFLISIILSSSSLLLWVRGHPNVLQRPTDFFAVDNVQAYVLLLVTAVQAINQFAIGPLTSKIMFQRHKLEKEEGKSYNDADVSAEMKALNKKFSQIHGFSSLFNLYAVLGLGFHGLWIGQYGLGSV